MDILSLGVLLGAIFAADEVLNGRLQIGRKLMEQQSKRETQQD